MCAGGYTDSQLSLKVAAKHPLCPEESPSAAASGHRELSARSGENRAEPGHEQRESCGSESCQGHRDEIKDGYFSRKMLTVDDVAGPSCVPLHALGCAVCCPSPSLPLFTAL